MSGKSSPYPYRYFVGITLLLAAMLGLTSCAEGKAHFTIHRNGTADLDMSVALSDRTLGLLGQSDLMKDLAERMRASGMTAESFERDGKSGFSANRKFDLKELDKVPLTLPDGIEFERTEERHFFYTRQKVAVSVDLPGMMGNRSGEWTRKLEELPAITKKLIQSQLALDFALTAPLKLGGEGSDETLDGGRTQVWHLKLFEKNRLETSIDVPNVRRIAYVGGAGLLVVSVGAFFGIRALLRRRRKTG